jgi:hypothetical protein
MEIWIAQALGFVSYALAMSTFYQKDDRRLKIVMFIFNINHVLHYFLLGSNVSALSSSLSAVRTGTSIFTSSKYVAFVFIAVTASLGYSFAEHWWELWSIFGTIIGTYTMFMMKGIPMRVGFLLGSGCWLTNNILVGSIGGMMLEVTVMAMNLFTIYRLAKDNKTLTSTQTA